MGNNGNGYRFLDSGKVIKETPRKGQKRTLEEQEIQPGSKILTGFYDQDVKMSTWQERQTGKEI